ncbi:unnamed protein product [Bursaphelenchus okinawaensis]|uniref:G domain-containing protein n=1 Tax=Bursaphelenchus okinawaensis TaxID=465554 RepID=A0A811KI75_9BILA|nr:unnamed protein product [Bursaphelenchus okinawaensis]CAG9103675.1 unnamed protein product [Bursaphelenchus okinawaensis]
MITENQLTIPERDRADSLLDKVFSAVTLPPVHHHHDHEDVLRELDQVLNKHWDEDAVDSVVKQHILSEHEDHDHLQTRPRSRHSSMLEEALQNSTGVSRLLHDDVEEERHFEAFPVDGFVETTTLTYVSSHEKKQRSPTVDSLATASESRFGEFDLDDNSEINLNHPVVAYQRNDKSHVNDHDNETSHVNGDENATFHNIPQQEEEVADEPVELSKGSLAASLFKEIKNAEFAEIQNQRLKLSSNTYANDIHSNVDNGNHNGTNGTNLHDKTNENNGFVVAKPVATSPSTDDNVHVYDEVPQSPRSKAELNAYTQRDLDYKNVIENDFKIIQLNRRSTTVNALPRSVSNLTDRPIRQGATQKVPLNIVEENVPVGPHLEYQLANADLIGSQNSVDFYQPYFELSLHPQFPEITVGGPTKKTNQRTFLLIGKAQSGRTSFICSLMNFLYRCQKEHPFRLALELPNKFEDITDRVVSYTFNNTILGYNLTVIDTPSIEYDSTPLLIGKFVKHRLTRDSKLRLDAILPVIKEDDDDVSQQLLLNYKRIKYLFGDDLRTNLLPVFTFGTGLQPPKALKALDILKLPYSHYYKVNALGFLPNSGKVPSLKHSLLYKHNIVSIEALIEALETVVAPLLLAKSS